MIIYTVIVDMAVGMEGCSAEQIAGLFSTKDLADKFANEIKTNMLKPEEYEEIYINEYELDKEGRCERM